MTNPEIPTSALEEPFLLQDGDLPPELDILRTFFKYKYTGLAERVSEKDDVPDANSELCSRGQFEDWSGLHIIRGMVEGFKEQGRTPSWAKLPDEWLYAGADRVGTWSRTIGAGNEGLGDYLNLEVTPLGERHPWFGVNYGLGKHGEHMQMWYQDNGHEGELKVRLGELHSDGEFFTNSFMARFSKGGRGISFKAGFSEFPSKNLVTESFSIGQSLAKQRPLR